MSWAKKVRQASDVVKPGETVEAVVLSVNPVERRISLGLKQALGDPWAEMTQKFGVGSVIEGPVTSITNFGAFVQLSDGVEGMIHVSEISAEKRINHPQEVLKVGQVVKAQVLAIDKERRLLRLGMKQLVPTSLDEYIAEHKAGDVVSGRIIEVSEGQARVELGEGIHGTCSIVAGQGTNEETRPAPAADLSALSSMLKARWKGGAPAGSATKPEALRAGQIRSFRIATVDVTAKRIELKLS
jgi:small subunit ribosomal protein S1